MGDFFIYTTGAETVEATVEATGEAPDRIHSLVDDLGVLPPWQACYIDPDSGIVVHIFTAKKREIGSATRKANNYYAVYSDPDANPKTLLTSLSTRLLKRLESEKTGWEQVSSPQDHKSALSNPDHIQNVAEYSITENSLAYEVITNHYEMSDEPLHIGCNTVEQLRQFTWLILSSNQSVIYATELSGNLPNSVGAKLEYTTSADGLPLDDRTATYLKNAVERVTESQRKQHIHAVQSALEQIGTDNYTDRDRPAQLLHGLRTIRNEIEEDINPEKFDRMEELHELATVVGQRVDCIRNEAQTDVLDSAPEVGIIKQNYKQNTFDKIAATIDETVDQLVDKIIEHGSREIESRIEKEVANVATSNDLSPTEVQDVFENNLDILHTKGRLRMIITDALSRKTEAEKSELVSSAIDEMNDFIENEVVPELSTQTGLSKNIVENRLRNHLILNI